MLARKIVTYRMTEEYLRQLGFETYTDPNAFGKAVAYNVAWRYRHTHAAQDGTVLYAEHPLSIPRCRLSTLPAPLDQRDVLADVSLDDDAGLTAAVNSFFTAHQGVGAVLKANTSSAFRPFRRQE
jgi:hypothetical protein